VPARVCGSNSHRGHFKESLQNINFAGFFGLTKSSIVLIDGYSIVIKDFTD
jgi:hypothetical protein